MPTRDYVNRNIEPRKVASKKPKSKIMLVVIFSAITVGVTLAYFQQPKPATTSVSQGIENVAVPSSLYSGQVAPLPEPTWWYESELPNYTIEVTPKNGLADSIPHIMQCGAFTSLTQANRQVSLINVHSLHTPANVLQLKSWYLVRLGPYSSRRSAEQDRHILQRANIEPCVIRPV